MRLYCLGIVLSFFVSCGASTNPYTLIAGGTDNEAFDVNVALAQAWYDRGDFEKAKRHGEIAVAIDESSERANVLLGYIYLGQAGLAPFDMAKQMYGESANQGVALLEAGGTAETLKSLQSIIGISDADLEKMGDFDESVPDLPVLIPNCAEEARNAVEKLTLARDAVTVACPFVDPSVRLSTEARHLCRHSENELQSPASAHLLWAFAHLAEALAFHSVLTYSSVSGSDKSNLELRFDEVAGLTVENPEQIDAMLRTVDSLDSIVSKVMPISGFCTVQNPQTQLAAMVNDMLSVSSAFASMPGVPKSITAAIDGALEKVRTAQDKLGGSSDSAQQAKALKADLAKNLSSVVAAKLDELAASDQDVSDEQKTELCSSYESIAGDASDGQALPEICQTPTPDAVE